MKHNIYLDVLQTKNTFNIQLNYYLFLKNINTHDYTHDRCHIRFTLMFFGQKFNFQIQLNYYLLFLKNINIHDLHTYSCHITFTLMFFWTRTNFSNTVELLFFYFWKTSTHMIYTPDRCHITFRLVFFGGKQLLFRLGKLLFFLAQKHPRVLWSTCFLCLFYVRPSYFLQSILRSDMSWVH